MEHGNGDEEKQWQGMGEGEQTNTEGWLQTTGQGSTLKKQAGKLQDP